MDHTLIDNQSRKIPMILEDHCRQLYIYWNKGEESRRKRKMRGKEERTRREKERKTCTPDYFALALARASARHISNSRREIYREVRIRFSAETQSKSNLS